MAEQRLDVDSILRNINLWLLGALELGNEICELQQWTTQDSASPPSRGDSQAERQRRHAAVRLMHGRFQYKSALFLVALNKVNRWARELQKHDPEKITGTQQFLKSFEKGKVLRDMREHDDQYMDGRGRKQDQFVYTIEDGWVSLDATSTVVIGGEILLGGRVSVQQMIAEAQALHEYINAAQ